MGFNQPELPGLCEVRTMSHSSNLSAVNVPVSQSSPRPLNDLTELLDHLTHAVEEQLGLVTESNSILGLAFYFGDGLQRAVTDSIFDLFQPATWSPANLLRLSSAAMHQSMQIISLLNPEQARLAWQELRNKLEIFLLVKNLSAKLGLPPGQFIPLPALVEKAYTLSPFEALWAVEGVGHYYTDMYWEQKGVPNGLLSEAQAPVPSKSLLMLHAGLGLAFADRLLDTLDPDVPSESRTDAVLKEFISLCENNSRPGYLGAAIESLGLVTRDFYPDSWILCSGNSIKLLPSLQASSGMAWAGDSIFPASISCRSSLWLPMQ